MLRFGGLPLRPLLTLTAHSCRLNPPHAQNSPRLLLSSNIIHTFLRLWLEISCNSVSTSSTFDPERGSAPVALIQLHVAPPAAMSHEPDLLAVAEYGRLSLDHFIFV